MYPPPLTLTPSTEIANNLEQTQLEHYKKDSAICPNDTTKINDNRMIELKNKNIELREEKSSDAVHAGSFYGLPPEHILEFQKIAWEVSGMSLTYAEAWKAGHTLVNFFDLLIRTDNEVD